MESIEDLVAESDLAAEGDKEDHHVTESVKKDLKGHTTRGFPTLLPGLQFSLAGIIGRPDSFFCVPAVRFAYIVLSYL